MTVRNLTETCIYAVLYPLIFFLLCIFNQLLIILIPYVYTCHILLLKKTPMPFFFQVRPEKKNTCVSGGLTDPTHWLPTSNFFFQFDFCQFRAMCFIQSRFVHSVNSVTAADIFQTLELSVCMIVDFLQNGDRHSLSQCEKMSPFRGHLQARILFQYYAHVQYLAAVPPTTREGYCSQNNGTRERRQGKKI